MDTMKAQTLLEKYKAGTCTPEEKALVDKWYFREAAKLKMPDGPEDPKAEEMLIWERIAKQLPDRRILWRGQIRRWVASAASVLLLLSASLYLYNHYTIKPTPMIVLSTRDIRAGGNKAILTLADGSKIILDDAANGVIAKQMGIRISKTSDGQLIYTQTGAGIATKGTKILAYNNIETPIGFQYRINLPDGSKVWLNTASSLRYPVIFKGNERLVELTGEAYFEVTHNDKMPFRVKTVGQVVEDLGTHFNINAYFDEPGIRTTLLEGRVRVKQIATNTSKEIIPGQQTLLINEIFTVARVNTEQVVAWKDGLFVFDHTDLHSLMRQISRWYNLQIVYEGNVKNDEFFGEVQRKYSLDEVLKVFELGGLHFRVEGLPSGNQQKRLIVMP